jgi:hypothetical protein
VCLQDWECCAFQWDEFCSDAAVELCGVRNDAPTDAIPILNPDVLYGSTSEAAPDPEAPLCGDPDTAPGVWYELIGTGGDMTVDTCSPLTDYDSRISVYTGDCPRGLTCVAHSDNACGLQASATWSSQAGETYLILVHGSGQQTGNFKLILWCAGDFDADQDVDLSDIAAFQRCFSGADGEPIDPMCACGNLVGSPDVGLTDFRTFSNVLSGP